MVYRLFISRISGSMQVKEHQAWMLRILESTGEAFEEVDISDPMNDEARLAMQAKARSLDKQIMPPHLFRDEEYLGDYEDMYFAVENDEVKSFLIAAGRWV